jgi:hypothetical protein
MVWHEPHLLPLHVLRQKGSFVAGIRTRILYQVESRAAHPLQSNYYYDVSSLMCLIQTSDCGPHANLIVSAGNYLGEQISVVLLFGPPLLLFEKRDFSDGILTLAYCT